MGHRGFNDCMLNGLIGNAGSGGGTSTTQAEINSAMGVQGAAQGWYAQARSGVAFVGEQLLWRMDDIVASGGVFQPASKSKSVSRALLTVPEESPRAPKLTSPFFLQSCLPVVGRASRQKITARRLTLRTCSRSSPTRASRSGSGSPPPAHSLVPLAHDHASVRFQVCP